MLLEHSNNGSSLGLGTRELPSTLKMRINYGENLRSVSKELPSFVQIQGGIFQKGEFKLKTVISHRLQDIWRTWGPSRHLRQGAHAGGRGPADSEGGATQAPSLLTLTPRAEVPTTTLKSEGLQNLADNS